MAENIFYEAAITYINQGFAVFPLQVKGKKPLTTHGVKDASKDPAVIKGWWQTWPQANIGIATGQISGGLCVIDMDIDESKGLDGWKSLRDWQDGHGIIEASVQGAEDGDAEERDESEDLSEGDHSGS